jgi:GNAT superfamily N-acetyltransferase
MNNTETASETTGITIEAGTLGRIDELLAWRMETLREVFSIPADADVSSLEAANRTYLERELARGGHACCLVSFRGQPAACGGVCLQYEMPSPDNPSGKCAYLMSIYTRPQFQHHGIGRATVQWLIDRAREWGAQKIYLETSVAGRRLYQNMGFVDLPDMMILPSER